MRIVVTQKDIDKGRRTDAFSCPISQSIRRRFKDSDPCTGINILNLTLKSKRYEGVPLPNIAQAFIYNFDMDRGIPTKPFAFELKIPD